MAYYLCNICNFILFRVCQGDWATRVETNRLKMTAGLTTRDPVHIFRLIYLFSLSLLPTKG